MPRLVDVCCFFVVVFFLFFFLLFFLWLLISGLLVVFKIHFKLNNFLPTIYWMSPISILGVSAM